MDMSKIETFYKIKCSIYFRHSRKKRRFFGSLGNVDPGRILIQRALLKHGASGASGVSGARLRVLVILTPFFSNRLRLLVILAPSFSNRLRLLVIGSVV